MIIGSNWMLGYSHTSRSKDQYIVQHVMNRAAIADILEVFFSHGVNALMAMMDNPVIADAVHDAEDRTGVEGILISTPHLPVQPNTPENGFDERAVRAIIDEHADLGAKVFMPHQCTTDAMVDRAKMKIRQMDKVCEWIRERDMKPGLSTHMPESVVYADETNLDVDTYIQMYNAVGFLMQVEVDWIGSTINNAKKPVMCIKPMAAGRIPPYQAFAFVWNTIREQDMVVVGTMSPDEAKECIEISLGHLERRHADVELQRTRSKASISG